MKKYCGLLGVLAVCALMSSAAHAQAGLGLGKAEEKAPSSEGEGNANSNDTGDRRFYVSPMFEYTFADKDRLTKDGLGGVMSVGKRMTSGLNLELTGFYEQFKPKRPTDPDTNTFTGVGVAAMLFPSHTFPNAYVIVALHQGHGKNAPTTTPGFPGFEYDTTVFDPGIGYIFPLSPYTGFEMALRAEARYRMDAHTRLELGAGGKQDFYEPVVNLGVMIPLGKLPVAAAPAAAEVVPVADADGDGVPDDQDKCPDTPAGTSVNGDGCPQVADADADGIPDDKDQCPGTPAGTQVNEQGCPAVQDADGDGVPDDKDKCPGTAAGTTVNEDGCPPQPAESGCRAPKPGEPINLEGCATGEAVVLKGVNFEVNSSRLTANAKAILNQVADSLAAQPAMKVEIGGHTDGQGADKYNLKLSQRRAQAVMDYLVARGIDANRLSAKGYGKTQPVDTNETPEGRELNRRVELKVVEGGSAAGGSSGGGEAKPAEQPPQQ